MALERQAQLVVLDERLARKHALRLGLHVTGTLGVLLLAKERDLIPALAPLLDRLEQGGIHLAKRLVEETLQLAGETPQR
ncbi:MAG TPA: DUF3368 domain-containing protein [Thermoanaerobaculia bacterium]|nr:DUF3368 domain-containing protein [Thermoanaerobaculia bacterium]